MNELNEGEPFLPLLLWQKIALFLFSFFVVAFGQPVWSDSLSLIAACGGFACFWRLLLAFPKAKERFLIALIWFTGIQTIQLSWFFSHPYIYIYAVTLFCALLMGVQWGILAIWIKPASFYRISTLLALAGLWMLFEWFRLFLLTGLPFNPVGLTLSGSIYSMQLSSLGGVYGLSFWVILTNLLLVRAWIDRLSWRNWMLAGIVLVVPFVFGWGQLSYHRMFFGQSEHLRVVMVQSALPVEENLKFQSAEEARQFVLNEWRQIFGTLKKQEGQIVDLIVLPENLVPYGTFYHVFPMQEVRSLFHEIFENTADAFPQEGLYTTLYESYGKRSLLVSNAYLAQTLSNLFQADVMIGLEDSIYNQQFKSEAFSSAFHFIPNSQEHPQRYDKRVLVPMGEYIPFSWCRDIARRYGVTGSYSCGLGAKVFNGKIPMGASICYEEMYGDKMRENRLLGAELLVNLTNDGWYPQSRLPKQHFDHSRLRTVENGIPLVRACNTGVTGAVDSLGRIVGLLGDDHLKMQEVPDSILLDVPLYTYRTFYTQYGDLPMIALSFLFIFFESIRKLFFKDKVDSPQDYPLA